MPEGLPQSAPKLIEELNRHLLGWANTYRGTARRLVVRAPILLAHEARAVCTRKAAVTSLCWPRGAERFARRWSRGSLTLLDPINHAAAVLSAAPALHHVDLIGEAVIDGQLLACANRALAHIENVPTLDAGEEIRIATVIDDLRAAAPERTVEGPVVVESKQVGDRSRAAPFGFTAVDPFTGILDHLAPRGNTLERVNAAAVDRGSANFHAEARVLRIDRWILD